MKAPSRWPVPYRSDAFSFPFPDGVEEQRKEGATAVSAGRLGARCGCHAAAVGLDWPLFTGSAPFPSALNS